MVQRRQEEIGKMPACLNQSIKISLAQELNDFEEDIWRKLR